MLGGLPSNKISILRTVLYVVSNLPRYPEVNKTDLLIELKDKIEKLKKKHADFKLFFCNQKKEEVSKAWFKKVYQKF